MMDAARYLSGKTFGEFVEAATKYQELWTLNAKRAEVPADVAADLVRLTETFHLAVLNEDWCLDAVSTLPPIAKLAEILPSLDLRVFGRDANPDLMDAHLTNGTRSIPLVIVYDEDWAEVGTWGPRPEPLQSWVLSVGKTLPKAEKYHYIRTWYARDRGATAVRELATILDGALKHAAG